MEGSVIDLSRYRLARAKEDLATAKKNHADGSYRASVNRSYYAIFHSLRAITALDGFDSGKHSGIIAFINLHYVKTGVFDKAFSKKINTAFRLREKADYDDFYVVAADDVEGQIVDAEEIIHAVESYLEDRYALIQNKE